jgi:hypothetical protein
MWLWTFIVICIVSLISAQFVLAQTDDSEARQVRLLIHNRTEGAVSLVLTGADVSAAYQFSVAPGQVRAIAIQAGRYNQVTTACGATASGVLKAYQQVKLVFTSCFSPAANSGAPSQEKVHLTDAPQGIAWLYRYGGAGAAFVPGIPAGRCELVAVGDVTIYERPSFAAEVFSIQPAGFTQQFGDRTSDGWLGFDPGYAQAGNIGSFRLRWIPPDTPGLSGDCINLRVVWGPPPGICFDQTQMEGVKVYASPDTGSDVVATLNVGDFAAIEGHTADGDWALVDLGKGNTGSTVVGWVESYTLNVNGPCSDLPVVTP